MSPIKRMEVKKLPAANSTYSQAIKVGDVIYISGQIAIDPSTNQLIKGDIKNQTEQIFSNLQLILEACSCSLEDVFKVQIYITNFADIKKMNEIFAKHMISRPVKTLAVVKDLYANAKVEMEFMALCED